MQDETRYDDPLYKNVEEFLCGGSKGPNEAFIFGYNTKTGKETTRGVETSMGHFGERAYYDIDKTYLSQGLPFRMSRYRSYVDFGKFKAEGQAVATEDQENMRKGDILVNYSQEFDPKTLAVITQNEYPATKNEISRPASTDKVVHQCVPIKLPFIPTGPGFQKHLNSTNIDWGAGRRLKFVNIGSCKDFAARDYSIFYTRRFTCDEGYVEISSPLGKKTCELKEIEFKFSYEPSSASIGEDKYNYTTAECSQLAPG